MNKIHILGIGPGSKDYLLPITQRLVEKADVLIGGERALDLFSELNKTKLVIKANLEKIKDYIAENYCEKKIVVLVSGDPGLYSFLNYLLGYFSKEKLEVIPGISSLQLGFARAKLSWQDAYFTSLHGQGSLTELLNLVEEKNKVGIFTDNKFSPDKIAQYLVKQGFEDKKAVVAENLSYPKEQITEGSLKELSQKEFAQLTVMVIYDE